MFVRSLLSRAGAAWKQAPQARKSLAIAGFTASSVVALGTVAFCSSNEVAAVSAPKKWRFYHDDRHKEDPLGNLAVLSGNANRPLADEICEYLRVNIAESKVARFSDGEIAVRLDDSVRGKDCFVIQPICGQVNDNLVELLLMVSTLRRASAIRITAVIPYFGYARQDRKFMSRVPISAADVAVMLDQMGVDRVIAVDLHSGQIQGFFPPSIPVDNLDSSQFGVLYFSDIDDLKAPCVVSPDGSSVGLGKEFRDQLTRQFIKQDNPTSVDLAMLIPESHNEGMRLQPAAYSCVQPPKLDLVGTVENKDCIIVQDIIDTGDTIVTAAKELKRRGARQVFAFAPHGLFSGEAAQHIADSELQRVVVTNTTPMYQRSDVIATGKVQHLSLAPMLAEAILRVHSHDSVSDLFKR